MHWFYCLEEQGPKGRCRGRIKCACFFLSNNLFCHLNYLLFGLSQQNLFCFYNPHIINYRGYFCTLKELAQSMKKNGWLKTHVFELGIEAIMFNRRPGSKKTIMPLRFSVRKTNSHNVHNLFFKLLPFESLLALIFLLGLVLFADLASKN